MDFIEFLHCCYRACQGSTRTRAYNNNTCSVHSVRTVSTLISSEKTVRVIKVLILQKLSNVS